MMTLNADLQTIKPLVTISADADHIDCKRYTSSNSLTEFIAGFISFYPGWMKFLYRVRGVFVRFLGMHQDGIPQYGRIQPEEIPMTPGEYLTFFKVIATEPDHYWIATASESHLTAYLAVVKYASENTFDVVTLVNYHNRAGIVYFNVIRPFHHVVVHQMAQSGIAYRRAATQTG